MYCEVQADRQRRRRHRRTLAISIAMPLGGRITIADVSDRATISPIRQLRSVA